MKSAFAALRTPALLSFEFVPIKTLCPSITFARYKIVRDSGRSPKSRTNYFNFKAVGFLQPHVSAISHSPQANISPAAMPQISQRLCRYITATPRVSSLQHRALAAGAYELCVSRQIARGDSRRSRTPLSSSALKLLVRNEYVDCVFRYVYLNYVALVD